MTDTPVPTSRRAGRRHARRTALILLFQSDVTGRPLTSLYEGDIDPFARELAASVHARASELDARITAAAEGWTADRLGAVERNALRIAVHELETESVPAEVAIGEAVRLTKRYATDEGARLVNGILGRVLREREQARG
jgi:N utilization substance protein B